MIIEAKDPVSGVPWVPAPLATATDYFKRDRIFGREILNGPLLL
jgi:hypothetical protein